ncbi:TolC family protein [Geoalkalibacter sp.]|uniref:TolC family protein n=1 Tax=Geoalkalibacter sp. TaxID=3041440 RepID=UPI00272EE5A7|nr:TolC family protein [Geoalkalibacter sp.]
MVRILQLLLLAALFAPGLSAQAQTAGESLRSLEDWVAQAQAHNPELKASEARWEAFVNRAHQVGTFEDPMLMFKIQNALIRDPLAFDRDSMTAKVIGVSQMVPFFGKRELARRSANLEAQAGRWTYEERKIELERMVRESWYQLYAVDRSVEIVERNILLLDDLVTLAETLYGVGSALQQDVLRAQLERSKMEDMRISLRQQRRSLEARLNTLAFRPPSQPVPIIPESALTGVILNAEDLEQLAQEHRPLLRGLQVQLDKSRVTRNLARREYYPDFTLSLEYMQREAAMGDEGYDMYSAGVSFNLPVQRQRRQAMVAEAESEGRMALQEIEMLRNDIRLGIADGLARIERNRKLAALYQDGIIPQAEVTLDAALAAYRVGQYEFMNVLESQMALFNYQREYHEAIAEHEMVLVQLEGLVGTRLR